MPTPHLLPWYAVESPHDLGPAFAEGCFIAIRLGAVICFECRSAARQKAEAIGIPMEPTAGVHFIYTMMGMN
jgi:hypothetical protein